MEKKPILVTLVVFFVATTVSIAYGIPDSPEALEKWLETQHPAKEKVTRLVFYVRDVISTPTPTNVAVARANSTIGSPTNFGLVAVIDDPVTVGPEPGSKIIGRAEGIIALASLEETSLHMTFTIVFTDGEYNSSTLSFVGRNAYLTKLRQISIVGGTGAFALARGVTFIDTVRSNSSGDAVFHYDSVLLHY
ncbi:dirigent protein 22-like [Dorcoceras hygrometricum]|uniref:Dirigent protein n=1 Tax=Dorcoceras hygrometricum TaxID=472368 RepID=A0A2Z7D2X0_9LAMI|nr:dirigent protein 22-like [Dorcoceras hygrometricum]